MDVPLQMMVKKQYSSIRNLADNANNKNNRNSQPTTAPLGGHKLCRECGLKATKEVLFAVGNDLAVVERYCAQCAQRVLRDNNVATGSVA